MKKFALLMASVLMAVSITACGGKESTDTPAPESKTENTGAEEKKEVGEAAEELASLDSISLKFATVGPESGTIQAEAEAEFIKYVEEASGGKIKVEYFPNATLGGDVEMLEGCSMGTIQMCNPAISVLTTYNDKFGILDMPFLFSDYESGLKALNGGELGEELKTMMKGTGIRLGNEFYFGGYRGLSNAIRPVKTPEDLKGLKIRVMESPVYISAFTLLGANPTPMSFSELFTGLQNKTVDGQDNDPSLTYTSQYYEVQKYYTNLEHITSFGGVAMSEDWYDGLPDAYKNIIDEGIKVLSDYTTENSLKMYDSYLKQLEEAGMEVTYLTMEERKAFKDKVLPMYEEYYGKLGKELFDIAQKYNE